MMSNGTEKFRLCPVLCFILLSPAPFFLIFSFYPLFLPIFYLIFLLSFSPVFLFDLFIRSFTRSYLSKGGIMSRRPLFLISICVLLIFYILNLLHVPLLPESREEKALSSRISAGAYVTVSGTVRESTDRGDYGVLLLKNTSCILNENTFSITGIRITQSTYSHLKVGCFVTLSGILKPVQGATNDGQFDLASYYRVQGIDYTMKDPEILSIGSSYAPVREGLASLREQANTWILQAFSSDVSGILCAMLTGDRTYLEPDTRDLWQSGGITHMLAISGLHLSILGMGLYKLLKRLRLPEQPAGILSLLLLLSYTILTGLSVSSLRAFLMFSLFLLSKSVGRTYDPLTALGLSALLILLENPYYLAYSGFRFSFLAAAVCITAASRSRTTSALLLYLFLLPEVLSSYYCLPIFGIPINLIAVPLLPVILVSGIAGMLGSALMGASAAASYGADTSLIALLSGLNASGGPFALSSLHFLVTLPAVLLIRLTRTLLTFTASLPISGLITGSPGIPQTLLFFVLLFLFRHLLEKYRNSPKKLLVLLLVPVLIFVLCFHVPDRSLRIDFLDVGQGDCAVIRTSEDAVILVDCGSSTDYEVGDRVALTFLEKQGIRRIDLMLLTHADSDHTSGAVEILEEIRDHRTSMQVGALVLPVLKDESENADLLTLAEACSISVIYVQRGESFSVGGLSLKILNPIPALETSPPDANGQCIVFGLHYGEFDALFTGDIYGESEEALTEFLTREGATYELLKVAHHGSRKSTPAEFLSAVRPAVAVISVGEENRYGHPGAELLARLKESGAEIRRTDECGQISVRTDGTGFSVDTFLEPAESSRESFLCS